MQKTLLTNQSLQSIMTSMGIFNKSKQIDYKYNEGELLREFTAYVDSTYDQHYSLNKYQATEFIMDAGHGEGFCIGNIMKYSQRYGKKGGKNRADLLKVIHYGFLALNNHDKKLLEESGYEK